MARGQNVTLEIENLQQFLNDLEALERNAERGASAAIRNEAAEILDRSQIIVPVLTGKLAGSGFVGLVNRWSRGVEVKFGYGSPYALYQHFGHYEHDDGRRLFLEQPVRYSRRGLVDRIKRTLLRYL
jgi:hypothetical protein